MANVFISYAREDKPRAKALTDALEAEGFSVWWDSVLMPGKRYRQVIDEQLTMADCVIVIWTDSARESDWVQDEAEEGRRRGVLVPIVLDHVRPPAGFRQLQSADLSDWTGEPQHPEFRGLILAVRSLVQVARATARAMPAPTLPVAAPPVLPPPAPPPPEEPVSTPQVSSAPQPTFTVELTPPAPPRPSPPADPTPVAVAAPPVPSSPPSTSTSAPAAFSRTFAWPWWAAVTVVSVVLVVVASGSELQHEPGRLLLCLAPVLAGFAALISRRRAIWGPQQRLINWISLATGVAAAIVVQAPHPLYSRQFVLDGLAFVTAGAVAFALAATVILVLRARHAVRRDGA